MHGTFVWAWCFGQFRAPGDVVDVEFRLWCHAANPTRFQSKLEELQPDLPIDPED